MGKIELHCSICRGLDIVGYEIMICERKVVVSRNNAAAEIMEKLEDKYYRVVGENFEGKSELCELIERQNDCYVHSEYAFKKLGVVGI